MTRPAGSGFGRLIHRLVHPGHEAERARLDELAAQVKAQAVRQNDLLGACARQLTELGTAVAGQRRDLESVGDLLREARRDLSRLRDAVNRQSGVTSRLLKQAELDEELATRETAVLDRLGRLARSPHPVLLGPWTGEVGFELIYWIPFLKWAQEKRGLDPDRLVAVSRGGVAGWYRHVTDRYLDILSFVGPEEFRRRTEEVKKQRGVGPFDREVVRRVRGALGGGRLRLLHPSLMYDLFNPYWKQHATYRRLDAFTRHQLLAPPPQAEVPPGLPSDFVAVRFYFSAGFPDVPSNRAFVRDTIRRLADQGPVVLLNPGVRVDDHHDYLPGADERVVTILEGTTPATNLAVQSAVISRARAFVGTYGGLTNVAALHGVDSVAFYSDPASFFTHHLHYAERAYQRIGGGSLVILKVGDAPQVARVLGAAEPRTAPIGAE